MQTTAADTRRRYGVPSGEAGGAGAIVPRYPRVVSWKVLAFVCVGAGKI